MIEQLAIIKIKLTHIIESTINTKKENKDRIKNLLIDLTVLIIRIIDEIEETEKINKIKKEEENFF